MRRALAILLLLWTGSALADRLPDWLQQGARSEPRWPSLPRGREQSLPPAGLTHAEDIQDNNISPGEAARRAQQMNGGGRVLSVEPASGGWRVKLIKQGDVRIVFVPD